MITLGSRPRAATLERLESVMSQFSGSLDQYDLQDDTDDPDLSWPTDQYDGKPEESSKIPFHAIYNFLSFKSLDCRVFLDQVPIIVRVTEVERFSSTTRVFNPNLYTIELRHGDFTWKVKRRCKHFQALHQELLKFKALLKIPLPTRTHAVQRKSFKGHKCSQGGHIPTLPQRPDALVKEDQLTSRKMHLEDYLNNVLKRPMYRSHPATLDFLEVSQISFIQDLGPKGIEGLILKKSGGNTFPVCYWCGSNSVCYCWSKRWLVVKDSFVLYMRPEDGQVGTVILYDKGFHIKTGTEETGVRHGLTVENLCRALTIKCSTYRQASWWGQSILEFALKYGKDYLKENRHGSFAPVRENIPTKWFVNAADYFGAIADALEGAKEEIFITGWWLSPEIFLKRPVVDGNTWRLDYILKRKAEQGVKICVLLYKEVEVVLGINSEYTKKTLMGLHSNIKVIRHPDHVPSTALLWAHHEKTVVIDQSVAFLGGIDLAYGRWDDCQHRLTDVGSVRRSPQPSPALSSNFTRSAVIPEEEKAGTEEEKLGRRARDILRDLENGEGWGRCGACERGGVGQQGENSSGVLPSSRLLSTHTEEDFNYCAESEQCSSRNSLSSRTVPHMERQNKSPALHSNQSESFRTHNSLRLPQEISSLRSHIRTNELSGEARFWHGKDYCNFILKEWVKLNKPFDDFIDRYKTPRMPWHDIGVAVQGKAARDIARHFIQRWNFTKLVKKRSRATCYPCLLPKSLSAPTEVPSDVGKQTLACVQVLRSVCQWSVGSKIHEESIHLAYISAIQNSEHFIYIENQFFISCSDKNIHNSIGDTLTERILRAHREKKKFRVYVVMPLLPGFEGDISSGGGQAIKAIMYFNYRTMCRGEHSIIERLKCVMAGSWINYISFCGLRTHAGLDGRLVTELIYVHSKLMIVDDRTVIIGSANINDRSMLGRRDSEMAVVVEDSELQASVMDGETYQAGRFARSLREKCFRLVLGLLDDPTVDVSDPISDRFYKDIWMVTAAKNANVYDKVFRCLPTDAVLNYKILREYVSHPCMATEDPAQACEELRKVRGFLVQFPFYFLSEENLFPSLNSKEGMMPIELWT
ncbi:phospholipase D1 isoform X1 [Anguilla anguilla]|uniref:phospholipase D1 isoform X1 n=2 Tax=Anguilla anguilla TaxID=7936 RepID=UPI0015A78ACE|nr:phospholipase D1 isoform X1 [Anguilla anguilla]XP_035263649.1 phospholipase D1 isoform X1 [Anguilla anguilla]XP_035263650.1 phospholipase D1 isoform X1 [Anguilla anguilla]XP_035263651.1 phospholipase D1 isoform X1 [Anguilla anguilla]